MVGVRGRVHRGDVCVLCVLCVLCWVDSKERVLTKQQGRTQDPDPRHQDPSHRGCATTHVVCRHAGAGFPHEEAWEAKGGLAGASLGLWGRGAAQKGMWDG